MGTLLPQNEKIQIFNPSPCLIRIIFAPQVTARGIDDYYRNLLQLLRTQPGRSRMVVDFSSVTNVQLKATLAASKWLPKTQKYAERVGAFGLKPWMNGMLKAVLKISMREDIKSFSAQAQAEHWAFKGLSTNTPSNSHS